MTATDYVDDPVTTGTATSEPGAAASPRSAALRRLAPVALIAVLTWLTIDLIKASGPIEDFGFSGGIGMAALVSIGMYLLPAVIVGFFLTLAVLRFGPLRAAIAPSSALLGSVLTLVVARFVLQLASLGSAYLLGLATVGLSIGSLILALSLLTAREGGASDSAVGVGVGAGLAVLTSAAFGSWDPIWQSGIIPLVVVTLQLLAAVVLVWLVRKEAVELRPSRRLWAIGPYLAVGTMTFLNPAFVASQSGIGFGWSSRIVALGIALSVAVLLLVGRERLRKVRVASGIVLVGSITAAYLMQGPVVAVAVAAAAVFASALLSEAIAPTPAPSWRPRIMPGILWGVGLAAVTGLFIVLTQLLFQLDYDAPLPFPNWFLPAAAATALAAAAWSSAPWSSDPGPDPAITQTRWGGALAGAVAATTLAATLVGAPDLDPAIQTTAPDEITVFNWNVHYGVSTEPGIELEVIAREIEDSGAGVALLQEVNRGWVFGASTDCAEWLARRLEMTYAWAPAADGQFGNVILSRYALSDVEVHELPFGQGPQRRSAVSATITMEKTPVRLTSVHLQHRLENSPTRERQISALLDAEGNRDPAIIGGDMNAHPDWAELGQITDAGFVSAQDAVGDPDAKTSPATAPAERIDYIFGRSIAFTSFVVVDSSASDHLPLSAVLRLQ